MANAEDNVQGTCESMFTNSTRQAGFAHQGLAGPSSRVQGCHIAQTRTQGERNALPCPVQSVQGAEQGTHFRAFARDSSSGFGVTMTTLGRLRTTGPTTGPVKAAEPESIARAMDVVGEFN